MGYFTWKDCQGFRKKSLGYGSMVYVFCPNGELLTEPCYEGYGEFDGQDIYELVVDWNRPWLQDIFDRKAKEEPGHFGCELHDVAAIAATGGDEAAEALVKERVAAGIYARLMLTDWKRSIGIAIACMDKDNATLPFPIKLSASAPRKPYADLPASKSCQ